MNEITISKDTLNKVFLLSNFYTELALWLTRLEFTDSKQLKAFADEFSILYFSTDNIKEQADTSITNLLENIPEFEKSIEDLISTSKAKLEQIKSVNKDTAE